MKLLMTTDTVGGVWTYAVDLIRALRPHGVEVALATMGAPMSDAQRLQAMQLDNVTVFESAYKLEWMPDPWDDVAAAGRWLMELEQYVGPDVVHLNGYAHGAMAWTAPVVMVAHSCVLSWWRAVKGEDAPSTEWGRYAREVRDGLRAASMVVAPSAVVLSTTQAHYGSLSSTRVIHNGRFAAPFRAGRKESIVFSAGRLWDEAKNVAALHRVAPSLDWPVIVAGDSSGMGTDGATSNGVVRHLGRLDEAGVAGWLARAGVYALPARYEPFGLSIMEAALSGCALVVGDIPSLREVWADAATYVAPDDDAALVDAVNALSRDESLRRERAFTAVNRARRYTVERMAATYVEAYRSLATPSLPAVTTAAAVAMSARDRGALCVS